MLAALLQPRLAAAEAKVPEQVLPGLLAWVQQPPDPRNAQGFCEALHVQRAAAAVAVVLGGGGEAYEGGRAPTLLARSGPRLAWACVGRACAAQLRRLYAG